MIKRITRRLALLLSVAFVSGSISPALAQSVSTSCPVTFGFFNGVNTSFSQATIALGFLKTAYGPTTPTGLPIKYEVFYNTTNGLADFVETFDQRLFEQDRLLAGRFELFFESLRGGGSTWSVITATVSSTASILEGIANSFLAMTTSNLAQRVKMFADAPPTLSNYQFHRARIDEAAVFGKRIVFFAHSQGNLFANVAYDYALTKVTAAGLKMIHIAPASPNTQRGSHTLADKDLVINGLLRLTGATAAITDTIPEILPRTPGVNGEKDWLGHGLLEIYMNIDHTTSARIKAQVDTALTALSAVLVPPPPGSRPIPASSLISCD